MGCPDPGSVAVRFARRAPVRRGERRSHNSRSAAALEMPIIPAHSRARASSPPQSSRAVFRFGAIARHILAVNRSLDFTDKREGASQLMCQGHAVQEGNQRDGAAIMRSPEVGGVPRAPARGHRPARRHRPWARRFSPRRRNGAGRCRAGTACGPHHEPQPIGPCPSNRRDPRNRKVHIKVVDFAAFAADVCITNARPGEKYGSRGPPRVAASD